uniref:ATP synthase F0 subunit 8 n=1 Tax=Orthione mesoamericana TaxID=2480053 RepID=A0A8K1Y3I5_9CRUS|nr:ATP synthase F0 subunit 8 [Orthione mesoamericana]
MPQMAPMMWVNIYIYTSLVLALAYIYHFFSLGGALQKGLQLPKSSSLSWLWH